MMKTDRLKEFDTQLPPEGHFERFAARLEQHSTSRRYRRRWMTMISAMVAASVVLLLYIVPPKGEMTETTDSLSEVVNYYNLKMDDEIEQIMKQLGNVDEAMRQELTNDLEAMRQATREYQQTLPAQCDENYLPAIISRHKAQMKSLEHIRSLLTGLQKKQL